MPHAITSELVVDHTGLQWRLRGIRPKSAQQAHSRGRAANYHQRATLERKEKAQWGALLVAAGTPQALDWSPPQRWHCRVSVWCKNRAHTPDAPNALNMAKYMIDMLVDQGFVPDDGPPYCRSAEGCVPAERPGWLPAKVDGCLIEVLEILG